MVDEGSVEETGIAPWLYCEEERDGFHVVACDTLSFGEFDAGPSKSRALPGRGIREREMPSDFAYDVFLSHSSADEAVVHELAERLRADGVRVWCGGEKTGTVPSRSGTRSLGTVPVFEQALEQSRVLVLCMSAHAFGADWPQLESHTFRFKDPLNKQRRFIPLRLDGAPIPGTLAQFEHSPPRLTIPCAFGTPRAENACAYSKDTQAQSTAWPSARTGDADSPQR